MTQDILRECVLQRLTCVQCQAEKLAIQAPSLPRGLGLGLGGVGGSLGYSATSRSPASQEPTAPVEQAEILWGRERHAHFQKCQLLLLLRSLT